MFVCNMYNYYFHLFIFSFNFHYVDELENQSDNKIVTDKTAGVENCPVKIMEMKKNSDNAPIKSSVNISNCKKEETEFKVPVKSYVEDGCGKVEPLNDIPKSTEHMKQGESAENFIKKERMIVALEDTYKIASENNQDNIHKSLENEERNDINKEKKGNTDSINESKAEKRKLEFAEETEIESKSRKECSNYVLSASHKVVTSNCKSEKLPETLPKELESTSANFRRESVIKIGKRIDKIIPLEESAKQNPCENKEKLPQKKFSTHIKHENDIIKNDDVVVISDTDKDIEAVKSQEVLKRMNEMNSSPDCYKLKGKVSVEMDKDAQYIDDDNFDDKIVLMKEYSKDSEQMKNFCKEKVPSPAIVINKTHAVSSEEKMKNPYDVKVMSAEKTSNLDKKHAEDPISEAKKSLLEENVNKLHFSGDCAESMLPKKCNLEKTEKASDLADMDDHSENNESRENCKKSNLYKMESRFQNDGNLLKASEDTQKECNTDKKISHKICNFQNESPNDDKQLNTERIQSSKKHLKFEHTPLSCDQDLSIEHESQSSNKELHVHNKSCNSEKEQSSRSHGHGKDVDSGNSPQGHVEEMGNGSSLRGQEKKASSESSGCDEKADSACSSACDQEKEAVGKGNSAHDTKAVGGKSSGHEEVAVGGGISSHDEEVVAGRNSCHRKEMVVKESGACGREEEVVGGTSRGREKEVLGKGSGACSQEEKVLGKASNAQGQEEEAVGGGSSAHGSVDEVVGRNSSASGREEEVVVGGDSSSHEDDLVGKSSSVHGREEEQADGSSSAHEEKAVEGNNSAHGHQEEAVGGDSSACEHEEEAVGRDSSARGHEEVEIRGSSPCAHDEVPGSSDKVFDIKNKSSGEDQVVKIPKDCKEATKQLDDEPKIDLPLSNESQKSANSYPLEKLDTRNTDDHHHSENFKLKFSLDKTQTTINEEISAGNEEKKLTCKIVIKRKSTRKKDCVSARGVCGADEADDDSDKMVKITDDDVEYKCELSSVPIDDKAEENENVTNQNEKNDCIQRVRKRKACDKIPITPSKNDRKTPEDLNKEECLEQIPNNDKDALLQDVNKNLNKELDSKAGFSDTEESNVRTSRRLRARRTKSSGLEIEKTKTELSKEPETTQGNSAQNADPETETQVTKKTRARRRTQAELICTDLIIPEEEKRTRGRKRQNTIMEECTTGETLEEIEPKKVKGSKNFRKTNMTRLKDAEEQFSSESDSDDMPLSKMTKVTTRGRARGRGRSKNSRQPLTVIEEPVSTAPVTRKSSRAVKVCDVNITITLKFILLY